MKFTIQSSGVEGAPDYRHVDVYVSNEILTGGGLPARQLVTSIKAASNTDTQLYFEIELRQFTPGNDDTGDVVIINALRMWKGTVLVPGPGDTPMYLITDPADDFYQSLIWGAAPEGSIEPYDFVKTDFQDNP